MIREPIISVLGHVDHGKTLFLDKIRGSMVAEREAGRITQHIGATEVPVQVIKDLSGELLEKFGFSLSIPGLLFIDTPGHEAFTNLRKRGGSIADLAVLVVDVNQGFQPQTIEALEILRSYKTPFIVVASKIDKLANWNSKNGSFLENLKEQSGDGKKELDEKVYMIVSSLHRHGFASERFDRCDDFAKQVPIVPVSSVSGEGIPETLMLLAGLSQRFLRKNLEVSENEKMNATVLEVREELGFGATIDIILYTGSLRVGDEIVLAGKQGIIRTKVRALLKPGPLEEMRDSKKRFESVSEVTAACGVKVAAPGLDSALPGSPIVSETGKKVEERILKEIESAKVKGKTGIVIKADTLGSLEALTRMLSGKGQPIKSADIGVITKHDVIEAESVKRKDPLHGVVLGFNVETDEHALMEAKKAGVKIFTGKVIYALLEDFEKFLEEESHRLKEKKEKKVVLPAKFKFLKGFVFRRSKPAVLGVKVLSGRLRTGVKAMNSKGRIIGKIGGLQRKGKDLSEAREGEEIAISVSGAVVGRNIEEGETLFTFIPESHFSELGSLELSEEEKGLLEEIKSIESKTREGIE